MNRLVFVTGCGRGIGQAIALHLQKNGFTVSGCSRSLGQLEETSKLSDGKIRVSGIDVTDEKKLESWFDYEISNTEATPWGLVTAAGVYGPIGNFTENSWAKWKESLEINLYGTILACKFFTQNLIKRNLPGRIVLLSGGGATRPLPNFSSYCATKAAVVRFGETIAYELESKKITVNSIAPGAINTQLTEELIKAGPQKAGKEMYDNALKQKETGGTAPLKAAELTTYLMGENGGSITGKLISAVWDPWGNLHKDSNLDKSDIYTLRRIVPKDRQ